MQTQKFLSSIQNQSDDTKRTRNSKYLTRKDLIICTPPLFTNHHQQTQQESLSCRLLFVKSTTSTTAGFANCKITEITKDGQLPKEPEIRHCTPVDYPNFLTTYIPKVYSPPIEVYCSDRSAAYQYKRRVFGTDDLLTLYKCGLKEGDLEGYFLSPPRVGGLDALMPLNGWSRVRVPDRTALLSDSGKLLVLDQLLTRLKSEGHRVLIFSQMTKMIDILEEFMNFRHHTHMRLDGSSKICDRRDMVSDFQSRDDVFAFLLSTRAGGLGINLTAADTVIFYDSDWNPTVDQQAMDRAHRLGQKRQVTVYRLVTKGTVEEKILNRAREKSEIQNIVISGGQFNKDVLKPKEVVSLLLDDVELEAKLKQKQAEKKLAELTGKRPGRKRKNPVEVNTTDGEVAKITKTASDTNLEALKNEHLFQRTDSVESIDENSMSSIDFSGTNNSDNIDGSSSRPPSAVGSPSQSPSSSSNAPTSRRGRGRGRGRGSGKTKSGALAKAAASVAAAAGAMAGRDAAYAQYGYSFQKTS